MKRKECKAIRAAVKRYAGNKLDLGAWLIDWYEKHFDELAENLAAPMRVYALLTGRNDPSDMADYRAQEEIDQSRAVVHNMLANDDYESAINTLLDEWELSCTQPK
jgi:hypothetical protein